MSEEGKPIPGDRSGTEEEADDSAPSVTSKAMGVAIPAEHVGAFVAEVFEDPERDTNWEGVVDNLVAPDAVDSWEQLSPVQQAIEVLAAADGFDKEAIDILESLPEDGPASDRIRRRYREARRVRRNADMLRDGIADAYATGYLDDEALLEAVETFAFDTGRIAHREREVERVASAFALDFRPYGGTLFTEDTPITEGGAPEW